jgi:hypothetical protein
MRPRANTHETALRLLIRQSEGNQFACRNKSAITYVTVHGSLISRRHPVAQRKRRPFSGGVFFHLHDWN